MIFIQRHRPVSQSSYCQQGTTVKNHLIWHLRKRLNLALAMGTCEALIAKETLEPETNNNIYDNINN